MTTPYDPRAAGALCDACPLSQGGRPITPEGNPAAAVALIGGTPAEHEIKRGKPFVGPASIKLGEVLYKVGAKREQFWLTYATLCRIDVPGLRGKDRFDPKKYAAWLSKINKMRKKGGAALIPSPFACCAPRLAREIEALETAALARGAPNGLVVMPMDNAALDAVAHYVPKTGNAAISGIAKFRGSVISGRLGNGT